MVDGFLIRRRLALALDLLARERAAMRAGDFAALDALTVRRDATMRALSAADGPELSRHEHLVRRLRDEAERNRRMLEACLRGVQAANRRLREIADSKGQIGVYTKSGQRLATPAAGRERRS